MTPALRTACGLAALVAFAALDALAASPQNHFILPCDACAAPRWVPTGSLNVARWGHTATLLADGKVLVVGGRSADASASAELYDPETRAWSLTAPMSVARASHTATLLEDGRVLVVGGEVSDGPPGVGPRRSAEIYDPSSGTWTAAARMDSVRPADAAVRLLNGKVLVAGGYDADDLDEDADDFVAQTALYDPETDSWAYTGDLKIGRWGPTLTLLPDGDVLMVGGSNSGDLMDTLSRAEIYDHVSGEWRFAGESVAGGVFAPATPLFDGRVLVAGGNGGGVGCDVVFDDADVFDASTGRWTSAGNLATRRYFHTATTLRDGSVLVTGGQLQIGCYPGLQTRDLVSSERFDPVTMTWSPAASLNAPRMGHTATLLQDGSVLVAGGATVGPGYTMINSATAELFRASALAAMPVPGAKPRTVVPGPGRRRFEPSAP